MKKQLLILLTVLLSSCATFSPKEIDGKYGSYMKSGFISSSEVRSMEDKFGLAMRVIDERIDQKDYFGHLSDYEYQEAISEIITGMSWNNDRYSVTGYYYYKDYANNKEYYDLHFNSQSVTYKMVWTGPGERSSLNTSVISVETNPDSILVDTFDSRVIYLVLLDDEFYVLKSAKDVNSFVGKDFDKAELIRGRYLALKY